MIGVIAISITIFFCLAFSASAKDGWTEPAKIEGTSWAYGTMIAERTVAQCQIHPLLSSSNKSSEAYLRVMILSRGSVDVLTEDSQLRHRVNMGSGWADGQQFDNILIVGEQFSTRLTGRIVGDNLSVRPADDQQVKARFELSKGKGFHITVGGLTLHGL